MIQQNLEPEQDAENSASLLNFDSALKRAVKLLSKRDFSVRSMRETFKKEGYGEECISDLIEHLLRMNYLNDERLSTNLLKKYIDRGKGLHYIKNEFFKRALPFSTEVYKQFLITQGIGPSDHVMATIERASRKYLHQCESLYDFERKVLSYLFRQGQIQDQNEVASYRSTVRQLWISKEIPGSN